MLEHRCCSSPSLVVQRLCATQAKGRGGRGSGSGGGSCCCFAYCYARGYVRGRSRDVAINTRFAGHAGYLGACFHSRAPIPVNNRQSPVCADPCSATAAIACHDKCCLSSWANQRQLPPGVGNLLFIIPAAAKSSRPFTAYRSCPCSAFSVQPQRPP